MGTIRGYDNFGHEKVCLLRCDACAAIYSSAHLWSIRRGEAKPIAYSFKRRRMIE